LGLFFFFTDAFVYKTVGGISRPQFHGCEEYDGMQFVKRVPMLWRKLLPLSSGKFSLLYRK